MPLAERAGTALAGQRTRLPQPSAGLPATELPDGAFDPVLVLLARLAARRHGQAALLRALTRTERAPAAVNAI